MSKILIFKEKFFSEAEKRKNISRTKFARLKAHNKAYRMVKKCASIIKNK